MRGPDDVGLVGLDAVGLADLPWAGGKAARLGAMLQAGLPVPAGFVVPAAAFRQALRLAELWERALAIGRGEADPALGAAVSALNPAGAADWVAAARRLGTRVVVRSSGLDEDGRRRSFAGMYETVLDVRPDDVPAAIVRCWASLYGATAASYRGPRRVDAGGMAVVVQALVRPRCAGVLFTMNPMNGSWREIVVEAVWGLGEGLVSGAAPSHGYIVRRPRRNLATVQRLLSRVRLHVVQAETPPLAERWVSDGAGGAQREPVPAALRDQPTLARGPLMRLCRLGLRCESLFGEPQDVEWVVDDRGDAWLVQSRPITMAGPPRRRDDVLWTRRFLGERWPEPATPLGWSLIAPVIESFVAYPETQVRHLGGGPALKLEQGRPYVNATVFRHLLFKLPGQPPPRFMLDLVPPDEEAEWQHRFAAMPDMGVYAAILRETVALRRWQRFRWNPFTNHLAWEAFRTRLAAELPVVSREATSALDAVRLVEAQLELVSDYVGVHVTSLLFANLFDQLLEGALHLWVPERAGALRDALAVCPPGNLTLETNARLHTLAGLATPADLAALRDGRGGTGAFWDSLSDFLAEMGHRSASSWEVFAERWGEHPGLLVPLLEAAGRAGGEAPLERASKQEASFAVAEAELGGALSGWRRAAARALVGYTRAYLLLRENQRFWFDKLLFALQRTLRGLGARFVARGWLDEPDDVAYLTWSEVRGAAEGALVPDRAWVARRRAQREADARVLPPVFLRGVDAEGPPPAEGRRLEGLGISPGRARGKVRVVRSPADAARIERGDVLVAHAVDPGWTAMFLQVSAVVLEMGSRLSHGAVVAREYGIPAVVNVDRVTRRLVDGQEVTVDGTRGIVWVHP